MRRPVGVLVTAALAIVLSAAFAIAAPLRMQTSRPDLGSQLMLRLFGETSDSSASFAATYGDRSSESPLRELALYVGPREDKGWFVNTVASGAPFSQPGVALHNLSERDVSYLAQAAATGLLKSDVHFAPLLSPDAQAPTALSDSALFTAAYRPVQPVPDISPAPGTLAFGSPGTPAPIASQRTLQVGHIQFEGHVGGSSTQTPQLSLHDTAYNAGANFDVRAGQRHLNVNLSGVYEHLARDDSNSFSASTLDPSSWQLPGSGAPAIVPNYANLNRFSVGAGLAVPVLRRLTLNLNYDAQRMYGGYGLPGLVNLDAVSNTYGGRLTFDIPDSSSSLSIAAYQDRFADSLLPINGTTQTREDVNFTVKF